MRNSSLVGLALLASLLAGCAHDRVQPRRTRDHYCLKGDTHSQAVCQALEAERRTCFPWATLR